ncbi:protein RALF-like 24 [Corylus avellana]|uniref:protein RALF-like 24 n=1 Tax=Corylus avellana TaxID=13451 RepID=UPI001E1F11A2|nr:protein RALF-like 24 [Corylus avellana]
MSKPSLLPVTFLYLVVFFLHTQLSICNGVSVLGLDSLKNSEIDGMVKRACTQTIGECLTETEMDSESNRRVLAMQRKYISYATLRRDMTPCAKPGAPYYNCNAGVANPYNRGCEVITRCARGIIKT